LIPDQLKTGKPLIKLPGKAEKLTEKDLKGKKVDADPSHEEGRPAQ